MQKEKEKTAYISIDPRNKSYNFYDNFPAYDFFGKYTGNG